MIHKKLCISCAVIVVIMIFAAFLYFNKPVEFFNELPAPMTLDAANKQLKDIKTTRDQLDEQISVLNDRLKMGIIQNDMGSDSAKGITYTANGTTQENSSINIFANQSDDVSVDPNVRSYINKSVSSIIPMTMENFHCSMFT